MGAPVPPMQRVSDSTENLMAEIDALSDSLTAGHRSMEDFNNAVGRWRNKFGDKLPDPPTELNPVDCGAFKANEFGNCINLHWCFRVFGVELRCQQTRKEVIPKTMKEHRKLEVD